MQYYRFELDNKSQDPCTIIAPFGKYKYLRLPMGLRCSPGIAQAIMEMYCQKIDEEFIWYVWIPMTRIHMIRIHMMWIHMILCIHIYNDVGAFSTDWNHHVKLSATILCWLHKNGFTINPLKCEWAIRETDWFEYWLTPQGLYLGKRTSMPYSTWIDLAMPQNCAYSLAVQIIIVTCCQDAHISLNHWRINPVWQPISWTDKMHKAVKKCVCLWLQEHSLSRL